MGNKKDDLLSPIPFKRQLKCCQCRKKINNGFYSIEKETHGKQVCGWCSAGQILGM